MSTEENEKYDHRCFRCNHHLSRPESIKEGLGPVCILKEIHERVLKQMMGVKKYFGKKRR
jgi:hypothetical protein